MWLRYETKRLTNGTFTDTLGRVHSKTTGQVFSRHRSLKAARRKLASLRHNKVNIDYSFAIWDTHAGCFRDDGKA